MAGQSSSRVLVIQDDAANTLNDIGDFDPDLGFFGCEPDETVEQALDRVQPEIVFGLHGNRFPAHSHAAALSCPTVRWLHNGGAGIDHLGSWDPERVVVTNSAGVSARYMAETVIGAILMMNFGFPEYFRQQQQHVWRKNPWTSLSEKTILVIGLGGIGSLVAERARIFGARVIGARRSGNPCPAVDEQVRMSELSETLPLADYVCIHLPNTAETHHLVDAAFLSGMKKGARLINTSRGALVDENALIDSLRSGHLAGAYLDVFETEPLPKTSALWDLPGVVITPHHSDAAQGWQIGSTEFFKQNLRRYRDGKPLLNQCNPQAGY